MEAPLGKLVRRILSNEHASKKLMQQIIIGERFEEKSDAIHLEEKRIKVSRVASLNGGPHKKS
jgi:hypothetical protein